MKSSEINLYEVVLQKSSPRTQAMIAIGELAELIAVLTKHFVQGKDRTADIIEEIVDVKIMIDQLEVVMHKTKREGRNINQEMLDMKAYKLDRLVKWLQEGKIPK